MITLAMSPSSAPRIALLLAGQLRTLSAVLMNLRIKILEPLRPDVFKSVSLATLFRGKCGYFHTSLAAACTQMPEKLHEILYLLNPVNQFNLMTFALQETTSTDFHENKVGLKAPMKGTYPLVIYSNLLKSVSFTLQNTFILQSGLHVL